MDVKTSNQWFSRRRPARPVGLFRVGVGLAALVHVFEAARAFDFPTPPERVALSCALIAAIGLTVGSQARAAAAVLMAAAIWHSAGQSVRAQHDVMMIAVLATLTFVRSGAAWSVRWLRDGRPDREVAWWPVWLVQVLVSLAYLVAGILRVHPVLVAAAAVGVGLALWSPVLRPWAFFAGFLLHCVAIVIAPSASLIALTLLIWSAYLLFLDATPKSRLVVWDDGCTFCRGWVTWLRRFDWLAVHRFEGSSRSDALAEAQVTSDEANEEIKLRAGSRTLGGFRVIVAILECLPIGILWASALRVPPLVWIGDAAYRRVARQRHCLLPKR